MAVEVQALGERHFSAVLEACSDWAELAQFGPPYWRPRSQAELRRKVAATAGPSMASEYSFVLVVQEAELRVSAWRTS
jgi:hypothetical protein